MKVRFTARNWLGLTCRFGLIEFVDGIAEVTKEGARYLAGLIDIAEVSDAQLVGDLKRTPSAHNRDTDVLLSLDPRRDKANFV